MLAFRKANFVLRSLKRGLRCARGMLAQTCQASGVRRHSGFKNNASLVESELVSRISYLPPSRHHFPTKRKRGLPEQTKTRLANAREKDAIDKRNSEIVKTFPLAPHVLPGYVFLASRRNTCALRLLGEDSYRQKISLRCTYIVRILK